MGKKVGAFMGMTDIAVESKMLAECNACTCGSHNLSIGHEEHSNLVKIKCNSCGHEVTAYQSFPELINKWNAETAQPDSKEAMHQRLCDYIHNLWVTKNHDYGDSFHKSFEEEGMAMCRIRLSDKLNRFKTLSKGADQRVADESMRDTLLDLANYAIMTVMELEAMNDGK